MAGFSWQCHAGRFAHSMVVGTMALRPHGSNALPLDLDLSLTGCDLLALPQGSHQARLSYWRFFGSGSMEVVNNTLRVRATNQRKILMLRCTLVLYLPSYEGDGHYNSAKISILPDHSEREETCSNTVQMLSISLFSLRLRKELEMNISTVARTELKQVSTPSLKVRLHGGSFRLRSSAMPKVRLVAKDAMVHMTADGPVEVHLDDEDTFAQVALAAPSVQTGSSTHTKAKAPARNFSTWYHLSGAKAAPHTVLDLRSRGSMIYVQASEDPGAVERSCALQVVRGDGATEKAVLLPHTKKLLSHVQRWVERAKAREEHRYIIYIHLLAPNAPVGMLELLSSAIYEAISLSTASLISGGMLQPNIQRIVAPVGGMNWLFPEDPCSPQQERSMRFAQAVLDAVSLEVDVNKMNMTSTRWLWNAKGDAAYTFQWVEAHDEAFWRPKLVTVQDVLPFLTAASITLTLSFASGILVVLLIILRVIPALRSELQRVQIMNTASYRVDAKQSWALSPTMVHWPTRGVLLRWGPRANALQFRSMRFSARLWPDGKTEEGCKGVVKTKRIPLTKLPVYPDLPNQSCFLFVADVRDVESMRSFKHHAHNAQLMELGIMQADKEQLPLKSGRPYQFQVTAYGGNGEVLGVSAWSMPTMIDPGRSFSELPLLLWRGLCGLLPSSSFGHFLKEHCVVFPEEPAMVVKFKKIRLSILGNAELLHSNGQKRQVQLYFSTSGKEPKVTEPVALSEKEQKRQRTAVPKAERKAEDRILTFPSEISLNVSNDLTEKLTVEVSLISQEGEEKMIAKWQHSWSHLLDLMRYSRSEDLTEVVLRAGLLPVAIFSAMFEISNTMLASTARPLIPKKNVPEIFAQIRPGATIFWGETVKLEWPVSAGVEDLGALEISIVSTKLNLEKLYHGLVAEAPMGPALPSILQRVQCASGQAALELCQQGEGMMACYLQARTTGSDSQVVACSGQFLVARPVLLQDLELCYAGFCARNGIPMERVDGNSEIVMVERFFHVISGFRAPFPVPLERKAVAESHHSLVLVENPTSCAIVAEAPVKLSNPEEKQARQRSTSKMSTAQASVKSMEQPLLMASASEADEEEKDMEQKLRIVVPHRQAMKIPMNVFWRSLILPDEKMALDVSGEPKAYFCFATLVAVLKDLGWSKDELQREYLMKTWRDVTEGVCLFEYGNTHELATLVLQFSNRGLWKAAAKCLLLKIGVGGYAGCEEATKSAQEAGELATELQAGDILNIRMVKDKCRWPQDVKDIWNGIAVPARAVPSPSFLPTDSLPDFLEALVYVPPSEELTIEASKLVPLAPFADAMEDLAWHRGPDRAIWHVRPSGPRKLRGLWLELVLQVFESMECIPSDLDLFFQCKEWAAATLPETRSSSPRQALEKAPCGSSFMLRLVTLKSWLKRVYLAKLKDCTFHQFQVIVQHMLKCSIPEKALYEEVFLKCPKIPEDDKVPSWEKLMGKIEVFFS